MKHESSFMISGYRVGEGASAPVLLPGPEIADAPVHGACSVVSCIVNGTAVPVAGAGVTTVAVTSAGGRQGKLLIDPEGGLEFLPLDGFGDLPEGGSDSIRVSCTLSDANGDLSTVSANIRLTGHPGALMVRGTVEGLPGADARETVLVLVDAGSGGGNLFVESREDTALASLSAIASEIASDRGMPDQEITVIPVGANGGAAMTLSAAEIAASDFIAPPAVPDVTDGGGARDDAPEAVPQEPSGSHDLSLLPVLAADASAASVLDTLLAKAAVNNSRIESDDIVILGPPRAGGGLVPNPDIFDFGTGT